MPKIRRQKIPEPLLNHLYDRIQDRKISCDQLGLFATWFETEPDVPIGKCFKRFPGMFVCGWASLEGLPRFHVADGVAGLERRAVVVAGIAAWGVKGWNSSDTSRANSSSLFPVFQDAVKG